MVDVDSTPINHIVHVCVFGVFYLYLRISKIEGLSRRFDLLGCVMEGRVMGCVRFVNAFAEHTS